MLALAVSPNDTGTPTPGIPDPDDTENRKPLEVVHFHRQERSLFFLSVCPGQTVIDDYNAMISR